MPMTSYFENVVQAPPVLVFAVSNACKNDPDTNKINLTVGAYKTDQGKPWVLPVVKTVQSQLAADETLDKEYLPILGLPAFCQQSLNILLSNNHRLIVSKLAAGVQAVGGTGAIRLGLQFLSQAVKRSICYVSNPTWPNHNGICKDVGVEVREYRYWNAAGRCIDMTGLLEDLGNAPEGAIILLHACAHNPTGMDPTQDQWKEIAKVIHEKKLFPFFDIAYQGFASGDLDRDAWAVRYFAESEGIEMLVAQSFSKNFGLYNERVGHLAVVVNDAAVMPKVLSQLEVMVRKIYSNPPNHGARIVSNVLGNPTLYAEWKECIITMADRIKLMRQKLYEKLRALGTPGSWNHIVQQIGMFSFTGLTPKQVDYMRDHYHIYMMPDGRINMCGLNNTNMDYFANAIHDTVGHVQGNL